MLNRGCMTLCLGLFQAHCVTSAWYVHSKCAMLSRTCVTLQQERFWAHHVRSCTGDVLSGLQTKAWFAHYDLTQMKEWV